MITLGLDIGSNSVGSAWVDTGKKEVCLGVSVFPAGVDEQEDKRGAPKNQARREKRSQRRNIHRRSVRRRKLTHFLIANGLLPADAADLMKLYELDPWVLRRKALREPLTPHEFGRVLIHLSQRRGAVGVATDPDDPDEGKVKEGMDRLDKLMKERRAETIGQLMADLIDERREDRNGKSWNEPIRNRQYRIAEDKQLFAGRELIRREFHRIVEVQRSIKNSELAPLLTDELVKQLDQPRQTDTWRHRGLLFGQRRTYWDTGTLGRCDLEPTERCVPIADRHASYFRVIETVNNIKIEVRPKPERPLKDMEREKVIALLRGPLGFHEKGRHTGKPKSSVSTTEIRKALGFAKKKGKHDPVQLSIEKDEDREINTDWFHREIVHGAIGEVGWNSMSEDQKESVNRAILKFDPDEPEDAAKLLDGAQRWWLLDGAAANRLVEAWRIRPKLEKRMNLSRRAILNLLPYMSRFDDANNRWPTQQEARKTYASKLHDEHARRRYETGAPGLTAADRYYMRLRKHQIAEGVPELPPAPTLSNPVVRKAIHEVRRHALAYLREFHRKPDRVVIEMARVTKQSERQRNDALARNRARDKVKKIIVDEVLPAAFGAEGSRKLSLNQLRSAVDRVILARQQTQVCPYCGEAGLTDPLAAKGDGFEIDHIVPYSRCGDNGLNNKVLVHRECNRGKGNLTPREWWGGDFDDRVRVAEKLFKDMKPEKGDYFRKRDFDRKWQNFNRELREGEEWKNSQLTDTAYAARQVAAYLADALFDGKGLPERGDGEGRQKVFFTMGRFTAMLRRDWQLFETLKPPHRDGRHGELTAEAELQLAEKNRGDHRQHAIDAAVIALTATDIKNRLANEAAEAAEFYAEHNHWPQSREKEHCRKCLDYRQQHGRWPGQRHIPEPPPWGDIPPFRRQILGKLYERFDSSEHAAGQKDEQGLPELLVISHRPVKRRLVGAFHEATHYGPVLAPLPTHRTENPDTLFTNRISADKLTSNHLRVPDGWDELSTKLDENNLSKDENRRIRAKLAAMQDPSPGKSGIVRDRALRDRIRKCLRANCLDPDYFKANQIKQLVKDRKLTQASGIPIKGVVLLRTNTDPVIIPRKQWDPATGKMAPHMDPDDPSKPHPRTKRVYIGGNNHHVEMREDSKAGEWFGVIVSAFDVSKLLSLRLRAMVPLEKPFKHLRKQLTSKEREGLSKQQINELSRRRLREWKQAMRELKPRRGAIIAAHPIIDRSENNKGRFVMSLAEGEMIYARRKDRPEEPPEYFVVCKLDKAGNSCRIHFAPHWDARKASEQDRWDVTPSDLKNCGPEPGKPPVKVRVGPVGDVHPLEKD